MKEQVNFDEKFDSLMRSDLLFARAKFAKALVLLENYSH